MSYKVSTLPTLTNPTGEDLLLIIDDPTGTPMSKKITVDAFLGNITSNVATTRTVSANNVVVTGKTTPLPTASMPVGSITWDDNYIYVCTANGVVKRAALSSF